MAKRTVAKTTEWIKVGGRKNDEIGHCERCGTYLVISLPMPLYLVAAMMKAFVLLHSTCVDVTSEARHG